jgi:hypothetical protein
MKKILLGLLLAGLVTTSLFAQDEEPTTPKRSRRSWSKVGGAGGFTPAWGLFKFDDLNAALKSAGMPAMQTNSMYLAGGEGYGYIMFLPNVRMGGMGLGGDITSSDPNSLKEVKCEIAYGGFLVDYVVPVVEHLDVAVGFVIGGGSYKVTMYRDNGVLKRWDKIWDEFGKNDSTVNVTRTLDGSFFSFQPRVNIEYALLQWFQLRVGVAYPIYFSPNWQLEGRESIRSIPTGLKPDGPVVTAGIMFGFFN